MSDAQKPPPAAPPTSTALAPRAQMLHENMRGLLEKSLPRLHEIASRELKPERLIRAVLGACSRTPEILECTPQSVLQCVMVCAQLGLEPNTPLGLFYLVPFKNKKTGQKEATPIIGYRGLVALARRSGMISSVEAHIVHENDPHEVRFGKELKLWHSPCLKGDAGKPLFGYAIATMTDGAQQAEVMTWNEIMKIKARSKASDLGPWSTDVEEMAKKTVFRRLSKWLPLTTERQDSVSAALSVEEDDERPELPHEVQIELPPAANTKSTRTQAVKDHVLGPKKVAVQRADLGETEDEAMARINRDPTAEEYAAGELDHDPVTGEVKEPGSEG